MFWRKKKTQFEIDTEAAIKELRQRIEKLENATEPFRVGQISSTDAYWFDFKDRRPAVTHKEAIRLLLDHCGVELKKIDGTPERIVLGKKSKRAA